MVTYILCSLSAALGLLIGCCCRSAADADRRMSEAVRGDAMERQRECAPEVAA